MFRVGSCRDRRGYLAVRVGSCLTPSIPTRTDTNRHGTSLHFCETLKLNQIYTGTVLRDYVLTCGPRADPDGPDSVLISCMSEIILLLSRSKALGRPGSARLNTAALSSHLKRANAPCYRRPTGRKSCGVNVCSIGSQTQPKM